MSKAELAKAIADQRTLISRCDSILNEPRYIEAQRTLYQAQSRLKHLQVLQSGGPGRYTAHYPNHSGGFNIFERVDVIAEGGGVSTGPVFVYGDRKLKCNLKDNRTGRWLRRDYKELRDWKKGLKISYNKDGTSTEEIWGRALREQEGEQDEAITSEPLAQQGAEDGPA